eukprot:gnl/TRDRNA2_/TRDRNA2_166780_c3_seq1.p1 gnl/TRDRNA2_/TRDRNA2_166780_c3~~gnl/TRDRNA2_/TRDRNA2_166780_c3_seq1.p1  ORF type:complete len:177 (+),score=31.69 gnl/TRDRNA2_/TRDRNA2_166780_c3_seq1:77-532(+)
MCAAHMVAGHQDRARRAVGRAANATTTCSASVAGALVGGLVIAPTAAGAGTVILYGAGGSFLGGFSGAAVGNGLQYAVEEGAEKNDDDEEEMPGAQEVHEKTVHDWAMDSVIAGVVQPDVLIPLAQRTGKRVSNIEFSEVGSYAASSMEAA